MATLAGMCYVRTIDTLATLPNILSMNKQTIQALDQLTIHLFNHDIQKYMMMVK